MKTITKLVVVMGLWIAGASTHTWAQGSLTPPGAPSATMKTLAQVAQQAESRTAITSLPYTITAPGSYYVLTNLTGVASQSGITIASSGVTLDLNGFELIGATNSYHGIFVATPLRESVTIQNGSVRNWGRSGIETMNARNSLLLHLRSSSNNLSHVIGNYGIAINSGSIMRECVAYENVGVGLMALRDSIISDCSAYNNEGIGIRGNSGCAIRDCLASGNSENGIDLYEDCSVEHCQVRNNGLHGIYVYKNCYVARNLCVSNGLASADGAGIYIGGSGNRVDENMCTGNDSGLNVNFTGCLVTRNSARANATNFAGTTYGVANILSPVMSFTDSQPWANFSY